MSARARFRSTTVSVDIDIDDVLTEIGDDDLKAECVRRGLLPASALPAASAGRGRASVSLDGDELAEIAVLARCGDVEGAMLHLERMLPRDLRVFSDKLTGARH